MSDSDFKFKESNNKEEHDDFKCTFNIKIIINNYYCQNQKKCIKKCDIKSDWEQEDKKSCSNKNYNESKNNFHINDFRRYLKK